MQFSGNLFRKQLSKIKMEENMKIRVLLLSLPMWWMVFGCHSLMGQPAYLKMGEKVKIHTSATYVGTIIGLSEENIILRSGESIVVFEHVSISRYSVARGKQRNMRKGYFIGLAAGALVGGFIEASRYEPCTDTGPFACFLQYRSEFAAFTAGAILGGGIGGAIGLTAGLFIKSDRWIDIYTANIPKPSHAPFGQASYKPGLTIRLKFTGK
jgi:hypothetical protein